MRFVGLDKGTDIATEEDKKTVKSYVDKVLGIREVLRRDHMKVGIFFFKS